MSAGVALPDVLTASRLVLGPAFVAVLPSSPGAALLVAGLAALTDFVDGPLARRRGGGSARGAALDVIADAVFVLCGLGALAATGVLSPALPVAAAVSLLALARAWRTHGPAAPLPGPRRARPWPDRIGHLAGILNYGAVLVGAGFVALAVPVPLERASEVVALVNVLPIPLRVAHRARLRRAD